MKVKGGHIDWYSQTVLFAAFDEIFKAITKASIYVQGHIKRKIGKGGGKPHRPSRPFEPPRRDTGVLASSINYEVVIEKNKIHGYVGVDEKHLKSKSTTLVDYGLVLELGRKNMQPRPYLVPSLKECKTKIRNILQKALK